MSAIVPPLDRIPKLPANAISEINKKLNERLDNLLSRVTKIVQDTVKLSTNVSCNDPQVKLIKEQLVDLQNQINTIEQLIPRIQQIIQIIKQVVGVARGIKVAATISQLASPVATPAGFIAAALILVQDATIVNSIEALKQFADIPSSLRSKLQTITAPLNGAINKLSNICNNNDLDIAQLRLPNDSIIDINELNSFIETEFYTEANVSDSDLEGRANSIEELLAEQRDLLTSLQEAPSQVYQLAGLPAGNVGKIGDYYIDTTTSIIYGPKPTANDWGQAVNL